MAQSPIANLLFPQHTASSTWMDLGTCHGYSIEARTPTNSSEAAGTFGNHFEIIAVTLHSCQWPKRLAMY